MLASPFSEKLSFHARHALKEARDIARYARTAEIEPAHLLLALSLESGSLGGILLENIGFKRDSLGKLCLKKPRGATKRSGQENGSPELSMPVQTILKRAYVLAKEHDIGSKAYVYAIPRGIVSIPYTSTASSGSVRGQQVDGLGLGGTSVEAQISLSSTPGGPAAPGCTGGAGVLIILGPGYCNPPTAGYINFYIERCLDRGSLTCVLTLNSTGIDYTTDPRAGGACFR